MNLFKVNSVIGFDISEEKVALLNQENHTSDVDNKEIDNNIQSGYFQATADFSKLNDVDVISICVTLRKTKDPDMSFVVSAVILFESSQKRAAYHIGKHHLPWHNRRINSAPF